MGKKGYGSAYGKAQRTCYVYIKQLEDYYKRKFKVLVVDSYDGQHVLPFLRKDHSVDCYEQNKVMLDGGQVDSFQITGFRNIINYLNLGYLLNINEKNFYENKIEKSYDFVYVFRSLQLESNKHISKDIKMRKLLSSVRENGYVYILYHLADNESDYINYPKNQYFRSSEITRYFDNSWEIINLKERDRNIIHQAHPFHAIDHEHRVGYIFARKKYIKRKYKYHFNIKNFN